MSQFSVVDTAQDVAALEGYLDRTARALGAMKQYIVAAHVGAGSRVVLDIGCGVGHDLELLARSGIAAIGVEPSGALAAIAHTRTANLRHTVTLVRAHGEQLPLRDGAVDGCRIERVLQHVIDPSLVLREACRCVRGAGLLTVFEADWATMRVESDHFDHDARWLVNVRNPDVGTRLANLVVAAGGEVLDIVEEHSVWPSLARTRVGIDVEAAVARRVRDGSMSQVDAATWLEEQHTRDDEGRFRATLTKRLVVARV